MKDNDFVLKKYTLRDIWNTFFVTFKWLRKNVDMCGHIRVCLLLSLSSKFKSCENNKKDIKWVKEFNLKLHWHNR